MDIFKLLAQNFRNIAWLDIEPCPGFNIIYGPNGSGKTSLLEAISYLACGRSFRSSKYQALIAKDKDNFTVSAKIIDDVSNIEHSLGISRDRSREHDLKISVNSNKCSRLSDLADKICVQVIHPQSYELIMGAPEIRRQFIDWGVYYSIRDYKNIWNKYRKILVQRNSLLKRKAKLEEIVIWDDLLCEYSNQITKYRKDYLKEFNEIFSEKIEKFLPGFGINCTLSQGWDNRLDLRSLLSLNLEKDIVLGYTFYGCHRADLKIKSYQQAASDILSRGQLKLLICAMKLSQGSLLLGQKGRRCIYLIDDLTSELDCLSRKLLLNDLSGFSNQVFITNIAGDFDISSNSDVCRFDMTKIATTAV